MGVIAVIDAEFTLLLKIILLVSWVDQRIQINQLVVRQNDMDRLLPVDGAMLQHLWLTDWYLYQFKQKMDIGSFPLQTDIEHQCNIYNFSNNLVEK